MLCIWSFSCRLFWVWISSPTTWCWCGQFPVVQLSVFRPGSSTQDALLYVTNDLQKQPDKRVSTAVAFFFSICLRPSIVFLILAFLFSSVTLRSQVPFINSSQNRRSFPLSYMYMCIHAHTCTWLLAIYP